MPKKSWAIQLEDGTHTVDLDTRWASGKRIIRVDGQIVFESRSALMNTGGDDDFLIGTHQCILHSRTNGFTSNYDLSVDGRSIQTGQPVAKLQSIPRWVWIFVVACAAIPVVTLGGAIPALLGIGGAAACIVISRHPARSTRSKALWAVGITLLAWVLLIAFVSMVANGRTLLTLEPAFVAGIQVAGWTLFDLDAGQAKRADAVSRVGSGHAEAAYRQSLKIDQVRI